MELVQDQAPQPKTQEQLKTHYGEICKLAGDLQYKILCFQQELQAANDELRKLNLESIELTKQESKDLEATT